MVVLGGATVAIGTRTVSAVARAGQHPAPTPIHFIVDGAAEAPAGLRTAAITYLPMAYT